MARKEFTEEEIAVLKTSPHVMDVSPAIIHFNVAFKELFWKKFQAGMAPAAIFREAGIDPDMLGKTRVEGFKGMLKAEIKKGRGFRDLTTSKEHDGGATDFLPGTATRVQRPGDRVLKKIVSLTRGDKGS